MKRNSWSYLFYFLLFDSSTDEIKKLSATCLLGYVHLWDLKSPQNMAKAPEITEKIDKSSQTIWGGRYLYQNRNVFVTFDGSGSVKILKYKYKGDSNKVQGDQTIRTGGVEKLQECQISEQPISAFDWSPDKLGLAVSTSFDQKIRVLAFTNMENL